LFSFSLSLCPSILLTLFFPFFLLPNFRGYESTPLF
jgi:hypothetical protein